MQFNNFLKFGVSFLLLCLAMGSGWAQTYSVLHEFGDVAGDCPGVNVVTDGTELYGMTVNKVFKLNVDGTSCTALYNLYANGGIYEPAPSHGGLVVSGSTLYVTTRWDGISRHGSVFKINTDGTGFTVLKQFTGNSDGGEPCGAPVLSGTTLFGTTYYGGDSGYGVIFKVDTDGTGFTVLRQFSSGSDGGNPFAGLVLLDSTLYGTTQSGGTFNSGTLFKMNTDGTDFTVLHHFAGGEAGSAPGALLLSGTKLYGTTLSGGSGPYGGCGTVFKLNVDGGNFTVLHTFTCDSGGRSPMGSLAMFGATLFGCTSSGGISNAGTIFRLNVDGSGFDTFKHFNSTDGAAPRSGLVLYGNILYGTAWLGGSRGPGVLFSVSLPTPTLLSAPQSQTAELGSVVRFRVSAGPSPLTYQWFFNGTNAVGEISTNSWLELTNAQAWHCGAYTVLVTNGFGGVTSPPAMLNVIPAVARRLAPGVYLKGQTGTSVGLDYTDSPGSASNWKTLATMTLSSTSHMYCDATDPLPSQRFYRATQTDQSGAPPVLDLAMIPAITLTGNVGRSVRLDFINTYGPTDAWATLGTVTLTNTSQLYFDFSAIRQPARLYQVVPLP